MVSTVVKPDAILADTGMSGAEGTDAEDPGASDGVGCAGGAAGTAIHAAGSGAAGAAAAGPPAAPAALAAAAAPAAPAAAAAATSGRDAAKSVAALSNRICPMISSRWLSPAATSSESLNRRADAGWARSRPHDSHSVPTRGMKQAGHRVWSVRVVGPFGQSTRPANDR